MLVVAVVQHEQVIHVTPYDKGVFAWAAGGLDGALEVKDARVGGGGRPCIVYNMVFVFIVYSIVVFPGLLRAKASLARCPLCPVSHNNESTTSSLWAGMAPLHAGQPAL